MIITAEDTIHMVITATMAMVATVDMVMPFSPWKYN